MTDNDTQAQLGVELERFKSSAVGRYLFERATDEIINATELLTTIEPTDVKGITELQNRVYRANAMMRWIYEGIEDGDFAMQEMQN